MQTRGERTDMWAAAAMTPLIAVGAGTTSWPVILIAAAVCRILFEILKKIPPQTFEKGKMFWFLQWLWASIVMGILLDQTGSSWRKETGGYAWIPMALLLIGVLAAGRKKSRPGVVGAVLLRILMVLYFVIVFFGLGNVKVRKIEVDVIRINPMLILGFMIPWLGNILPREETLLEHRYTVKVIVLALAVSFITAGTISYGVASDYTNGFYEAVRGISLNGVTARVESLLSAGMTIGWYCCLSMLIYLTRCAGARLTPGKEWLWTWIAAVVAVAVMAMKIEIILQNMVIGCMLLWGLLPEMKFLKEKCKKWKKGVDKR